MRVSLLEEGPVDLWECNYLDGALAESSVALSLVDMTTGGPSQQRPAAAVAAVICCAA